MDGLFYIKDQHIGENHLSGGSQKKRQEFGKGGIEMSKEFNVGPRKPTIRYSKQMKQFLSYLYQVGEKDVHFGFKTLDTFDRARKGETLTRHRSFDYSQTTFSLQRMGKTLTERGLVVRGRTPRGYAYNLTSKGRALIQKEKLENFFSFEWKEKGEWEI